MNYERLYGLRGPIIGVIVLIVVVGALFAVGVLPPGPRTSADTKAAGQPVASAPAATTGPAQATAVPTKAAAPAPTQAVAPTTAPVVAQNPTSVPAPAPTTAPAPVVASPAAAPNPPEQSAQQAVPAQTAAAGGPAPSYTVVKDDSLWNIARRSYDNPFRWADIFKANQDKIANPDLIYPGQVLSIPTQGR